MDEQSKLKILTIIRNVLCLTHARSDWLIALGYYESFVVQLSFLKDFYEGKSNDHARLHELNLGLIAMREFEQADAEYTQALSILSHIASQKAKGLKVEWAKLDIPSTLLQ